MSMSELEPGRRFERLSRDYSHQAWSRRMAKKTVLAIGIDPAFTDRAEAVQRWIGS
jgi:hypothetical protein